MNQHARVKIQDVVRVLQGNLLGGKADIESSVGVAVIHASGMDGPMP